MTFDEMYDFLENYVCADLEALDLTFIIAGKTKETAQDILYYYTGYNDFEVYRNEILS